MAKDNFKEIYLSIKSGRPSKYDEETHCVMVLKCFGQHGTLSSFCVEAKVSETTFWDWNRKHKVFNECYRVGYMMGQKKWENDGEINKDNEEWNFDHWKAIGMQRYGLGRNPKIRVGISPGANPYTQYKQLVKLAGDREFTSSELKQLMESINVGVRAHESFELQKQIDNMKKDMALMESIDGGHTVSIEGSKEAD